MMFSFSEIKSLTKAVIMQGDQEGQVKRVTIDSRAVRKGDLFVAIKGARFDGHRFISQAVRKGAVACIVSKKGVKVPKGATLFYVKDTEKALGLLARCYRLRFDIPVIAITGSAGKTTTKDMIASVLSSRYKVLSNTGSQNNQIGVPLTLFKLNKKTDLAVIEVGTNQPGDIKWLTYLVQPEVAVLTNIGESHLEKLKSKGRIFKEKFNLVKGLPPKGVVIFNNDDQYLSKIPSLIKGKRLISYGIQNRAKYRAVNIKSGGRNSLIFTVSGKKYHLNSPVQANIYNALSAIICGRIFIVSYNNIITKIKKRLKTEGRQQLKRSGHLTIIDDTYNANPVSFQSALRTLSQYRTSGRRILVCADMKELGSNAAFLHKELGKQIGQSSIDYVLCLGTLAKHVAREAGRYKHEGEVFHFVKRQLLHKKLKFLCWDNDVVLVKGSHSMQMGETVKFLMQNLNN